MNLLFFETSAKTGANIKVLFNELAKKLTGIETGPINNDEQQTEKETGGFKLGGANNKQETDDGKKKKKGGCC